MRVIQDEPRVRGVSVGDHRTRVRFEQAEEGIEVLVDTIDCGHCVHSDRVEVLTHNTLPEFIGALKQAMEGEA